MTADHLIAPELAAGIRQCEISLAQALAAFGERDRVFAEDRQRLFRLMRNFASNLAEMTQTPVEDLAILFQVFTVPI